MPRFWTLLLLLGLAPHDSPAAHLGMGLRVGEVTQESAIVWTRVTQNPERKWNGHREPEKVEPKVDDYIPSTVAIEERDGAMPGAAGQVRVRYGLESAAENSSDWVRVAERTDYTHSFRLAGLQPGQRYQISVELRLNDTEPVSGRVAGSFTTPTQPTQWQDVRFTVVTGQSYWDLDHPEGFHIYPAMGRVSPDFAVLTGDTVYLDSEAPRARTTELARHHWHRMYSLPRLVEFHRRVPGYWEVDDHDTWCNDCWPGMEADWMSPLTFDEGTRIFREQVPMGDQAYRTIRWGRGLQIWLVEGRLYRSANDAPDGPEKTIWGRTQLEWLKRTILESDAAFRVLVSPTPIVGPDRPNKGDNHANHAFEHEGSAFRRWTQEQHLTNFYICCGDRHWQYFSIDPSTGLREFSSGPASDEHAGGSPGRDPAIQPFHRQKGGFLSVEVTRKAEGPTIEFRYHDVHGKVVYEFKDQGQ